MTFDFLVPQRPVSAQTKNRANLQLWKTFVRGHAAGIWGSAAAVSNVEVHLTLVYLSDPDDPVDVDNIIKPIQDALVGLVYADDVQVVSVESHRRPHVGTFDLTNFSAPLIAGVSLGAECVYVRVAPALALEKYL
ncbi:MAG: RusA family crossover junction endodeoxyribonuclease [Verrucomicrobia bacterium]|nr:RusA family crossover junction endodeoxyribonuclease [Verrucomicrobiota bacterium]